MKRSHSHDLMMSLQEYDLYVRGQYKPKPKKFKELKPSAVFKSETKQYPSRADTTGVAAAKDTMWYTGEQKLQCTSLTWFLSSKIISRWLLKLHVCVDDY